MLEVSELKKELFEYREGESMTMASLPIDDIEPNPWNPNEMDDETFNRLADELEEVGFIDPIQVVPWEGKYRILGGEHRWRAAKILGYENVPAVILMDERWQDEDLQKFVTVRLNALHGKVNPMKFMELYEDVRQRHDSQDLQSLFAVTDEQAWGEYLAEVRKQLKASGANKKELDQFDKAAKELKTVDDLSNLINKIFTEHGDQLESNFMVFTFGGKEHLYCKISRRHFKRMKEHLEGMHEENQDSQPFVEAMIDAALKGAEYAEVDKPGNEGAA